MLVQTPKNIWKIRATNATPAISLKFDIFIWLNNWKSFDFNQFKNKDGDQDLIKFEDGKWILSVYVTDIDKSEESIYLMRQLNVALNRDINKLKRVIFYSNKLLEPQVSDIKNKYPRVKIIEDQNGVLLNVLQKNSKINFNIENPIFIIDPYGRAVMYFEPGSDPKLMLKDLKVLNLTLHLLLEGSVNMIQHKKMQVVNL